MTDSPMRSGIGRLSIVIAVLGILMGVVGLVLPQVWPGEAEEIRSERTKLATAATEFAVAYNTYDSSKLGQYEARLKPLTTDRLQKEIATISKAIGAQNKNIVVKDVNVRGTGVVDLNGKRTKAMVLVALDDKVSSKDAKGLALQNLRAYVELKKVDGKWLVDRFTTLPRVGATKSDEEKAE